jgi:hypothetical protein
MDSVMVSLRILHIGFGTFWVGSDLFVVLLLEPRLRALGPDIQRPVMRALTRVMPPIMMLSSVVTLATGVALTLKMRWDFLDTFLASGWGWAILIGFIMAVVAMIVGFGLLPAVTARMERVARSIEGRQPSAEEALELDRLNARIVLLARSNSALLLIALGTMAAARFV